MDIAGASRRLQESGSMRQSCSMQVGSACSSSPLGQCPSFSSKQLPSSLYPTPVRSNQQALVWRPIRAALYQEVLVISLSAFSSFLLKEESWGRSLHGPEPFATVHTSTKLSVSFSHLCLFACFGLGGELLQGQGRGNPGHFRSE